MNRAQLMTAIKAKLADMTGKPLGYGAVKQQGRPVLPTYPSTPGTYVPGPYGYEGPPHPVSVRNQALTRARQELRQELGRKPTREERRGALGPVRAALNAAGYPPTHPDNVPGWDGYPRTLTNPENDAYERDLFQRLYGRPITEPEVAPWIERGRDVRRAGWLRPGPHSVAQQWIPTASHEIDPNARIRPFNPNATLPWWDTVWSFPDPNNPNNYTIYNYLRPDPGFDPRKPERYNRRLPLLNRINERLGDQPPNAALTQDQMDTMRRDYYTQNPGLVPQPGQPGYNAWRKQNMRGR